ncbi:MAG: uncharacterized lipoprotein YddW (UPF0748 family) [Rubritalea sp.]|jgi:uncharacterized lipoprotein YddW (UPF0748 family)
MRIFSFLSFLLCTHLTFAASYVPSNEHPPAFPREFRGAWVACVYNIDWPSKPGLSASAQKAELNTIINRAAEYKLNAIIFQVRPNADAAYYSKIEPFSHWVSGTMGKSQGYDPLAYCIDEAHKKGIEVHAWFNPFRALPNANIPTSKNHVSRTNPSEIKNFRSYKWMNPASGFARQRALNVMLDVARRYDIDGIHIDDYFYPYPELHPNGSPKQIFPDGKTPAARRYYVDAFVKQMYTSIKQVKPHLRVGISPFGIWKPGVPRGTTASINAYEHLAGDSRKWLKNGWCDYLSPQLYWRVNSEQSFSKLLNWWRGESEASAYKRPVWPGIATDRVMSETDPGRPASEILKQVNLSRKVGNNWAGHVHWSMKSLMQNRGGVTSKLKGASYLAPALVPPMLWIPSKKPAPPAAKFSLKSNQIIATWPPVPGASKYTVQIRHGNTWKSIVVTYANGVSVQGRPNAIAISSVNRVGITSKPAVYTLR